MATNSRRDDIKQQWPDPTNAKWAGLDHDFALGELICKLLASVSTSLDRHLVEGA